MKVCASAFTDIMGQKNTGTCFQAPKIVDDAFQLNAGHRLLYDLVTVKVRTPQIK